MAKRYYGANVPAIRIVHEIIIEDGNRTTLQWIRANMLSYLAARCSFRYRDIPDEKLYSNY